MRVCALTLNSKTQEREKKKDARKREIGKTIELVEDKQSLTQRNTCRKKKKQTFQQHCGRCSRKKEPSAQKRFKL